MKVAVVDYGSGNLASASRALALAAERAGPGTPTSRVTADPRLRSPRADRIVLPGQGAFADCARGLAAVPGLRAGDRDAPPPRGTPFLGICVGMQLMAERGLEHEITPGFGWIARRDRRDGGARRCACRRWAGTSWISPPARTRCLTG